MHDGAETDLAWSLAELAVHQISERNRTDVYTAIGAGDCYTAICTLLETIVRASVPVPFALAARINDWHRAYENHADALQLYELLTAIGSLSQSTDVSSPNNTL